MNDIALVVDKIIKERDSYLKRGLELASYPHQSTKVDEIYSAFATAQGEFPPITKGKSGFGYKYAELSTVLGLIVPILSKHGLHITQYMTRNNILHTRIGHSSGQYFESQYSLPIPTQQAFEEGNKKKSYMQELGTIRTYVRRYEAIALLGINPEDDTDGAR